MQAHQPRKRSGGWRGGRGGGGAHKLPRHLALGDPRGHCGVLVMCDEHREDRAMNEVADLLNNELDERFPLPPLPQLQEEQEGQRRRGAGDADEADGAGEERGAAEELAEAEAAPKRARTVAEEMAEELAALGAGAGPAGDAGPGADGAPGQPRRTDLKKALAHKRARWLDLGGRGVGLVWVSRGPGPGPAVDIVELLDPVFGNALRDKQLPTRYTSRMLPLQRIVSATPAAVVEAALELAKAALVPPAAAAAASSSASAPVAAPAPKTFKVEMRSRNNTTLGKDEVISGIAKGLSALGIGLRACFTAPDVVVIVEAVKAFAGIAVVVGGRWDRFERYNIRVTAESVADRSARLEKARAIGNAPRAAASSEPAEELTTLTWEAPEKEDAPSLEAAPASAPAASAEAAASSAAEPSFELRGAESRFALVLGNGGGDATVDYSLESGVLDILHVSTPEAARGRGLAGSLVRQVLEWAAAHQDIASRVRASCTFASSVLEKGVPGWSKAAEEGVWVRSDIS